MASFISNVEVKNKIALNTVNRVKSYTDDTCIWFTLFYNFILNENHE